MFKPDVVYCHPEHLIYPLWQQFIHANRERFNKVIVIFTKMNANTGDYRKFVEESMSKDNVIFLDNDEVKAQDDWRNVAVNKALKYSDAEWVWFTEQDFFPREGFWEEVELRILQHYDAFGVAVDQRLHPCCIFAKRSLIERTTKNFGAVKDKLDHFGVFQQEIHNYTHIDPKTYYHMNGLSQNMYLLQLGQEPNYRPDEFKEYCMKCLELEDLHSDFKELFRKYVEGGDK